VRWRGWGVALGSAGWSLAEGRPGGSTGGTHAASGKGRLNFLYSRVKIGEVQGDIMKVRLQVTHLHTTKNEEITIPNSVILSSPVVNYSRPAEKGELILHTEVGIRYETPWRQVEAMLIEAARRTPGLEHDPPPRVLLLKLGDFAVTYSILAHTRHARQMPRLYADLHRNILDLFNEYGVQIMTPAYEGDPEVLKVVPKDQWFAAPATREGK
jgi:Mechanosensitive ion channel